MTTRRHFMGWAVLPLLPSRSSAQVAKRIAKLGVIRWDRESLADMRPELVRALRDRGYAEGKNLTISWRSADEKHDRADEIVREFVRDGVDIIVAGPTPVAHAARRGTSSIPIVIPGIADPVGSGLVTNLARPGGNITGLSGNLPELAAKRLEILKEALPALKRVAFLGATSDPATRLFVANTEQAARHLRVALHVELISGSSEFEAAFARIAASGSEALIVQPIFFRQTRQTTQLALKYRLPAISDFLSFALEGGLLSYGPNRSANAAMVADYIERILKGAKPGELPIQEPTRFTLAVNLKTAKALGVKIARPIIDRADEVIE